MRRLVFSFWSLNWFENTEEKMERIEDIMILSSEKRSRTTQERMRVCSPIRERNSTVCCSAKGFVRRFVICGVLI